MKVKLSKRLQLIAERVPSSSRLADIGSDHALLPSYLVQAGIVTFAIAGEVNPGPLEAATRQVKEAGLAGRIEVREGNGLAVLVQGEVDVITIAGMGGSLIASILDEGKLKLTGVRKLILQPNVGEEQVRRWLDLHHWMLESETIVEEDGKIYEILTALPQGSFPDEQKREQLYQDRSLGNGKKISKDRLLQMGPYLLQDAPEAWHRKWESELQKLEMISGQLALSDAEASKRKAEAIRGEMQEIREVLEACSLKAKP
jgi:tRNA (adenine22-N1)-methyltransferase